MINNTIARMEYTQVGMKQRICYELASRQCAIITFEKAIQWQAIEQLLGVPVPSVYAQHSRTDIKEEDRRHHILFTQLPSETTLDAQSGLYNVLGKSTEHLHPHTDMIQSAFEKNADSPSIPDLILWSQPSAAKEGGDHIIVPGRAIFEEVAKDPEVFSALMHPQAVQCTVRSGQVFKPVFWTTAAGACHLSFRNDKIAQMQANPSLDDKTQQKITKGINGISELSRDPNNQIQFSLNSNELVVMDHRAALHGVTAYKNEFHKGSHPNSDYTYKDIEEGLVGVVRMGEVCRLNAHPDVPIGYNPDATSPIAQIIRNNSR